MRVAIVGAGVGGLTLAVALRRRAPDVAVEVYERDESAFSRQSGYAIGLKHDGGLGVFAKLGLLDAALGGDTNRIASFIFTDQRGRELLALAAGSDERRTTYRVQRRHVKQVLLDALGGTPVRYDQRCVGYERTTDGVAVRLASGEKVDTDVVVGCDGVSSAIRRQLIGDERHYLGLTAITGDAAIRPDDALLAGGYFMTLGDDGSSILAYAQPDGTTHFSYTVHIAAESELSGQRPVDLLDRVRSATRSWHPLVGAIVGAADPATLKVRGYYDREPARSVATPGVWLIGDAAHPMSPFQGQGANTAMLDAWDFAEYLRSGAPGVGADPLGVRMAKRGNKAVLDSRRAAAQFHETSPFRQRNRNIGFRLANMFLKLVSNARRR